MDLRTYLKGCLGRPLVFVNELGDGDKAFVDGNVRVLGVLGVPLVGVGIAAEDKLQAVPLQPVTD
jgi:hypothetical protein